MSRYGHAVAIGKSNRYHRVEFRIDVDDDGRLTLSLRKGEARLQTAVTPGEAMELAAILESAARLADR
ncbi:MAG TPA: hypothetical protein VGN29_01590 [Solirubrobacteraceae bacterium]|jgi:hypothetical protein|nr:hypothetical protein [Solirubrobacteraceae bacterium]